jgi:hypothetical protein
VCVKTLARLGARLGVGDPISLQSSTAFAASALPPPQLRRVHEGAYERTLNVALSAMWYSVEQVMRSNPAPRFTAPVWMVARIQGGVPSPPSTSRAGRRVARWAWLCALLPTLSSAQSSWFALESGTPNDLEDLTFVGTYVPSQSPVNCAPSTHSHVFSRREPCCEKPPGTDAVSSMRLRDAFTLHDGPCIALSGRASANPGAARFGGLGLPLPACVAGWRRLVVNPLRAVRWLGTRAQ